MSPLATSIRFLQTQPDLRLVELAHAGHERAFEALVHRYRRQLLAYCRRLCMSNGSAEDVLQQALLQAWVAIGRDAEIKDVRAWLYRIVHNVAVSHARRSTVAEVELDGSEGGGGVEAEAERRIAAHEALAGLAALPELQRQVMLSTALEGRSHDEIAALMGLSHGAVRGLIYRARATLRAAAAALIPGPLVGWAARQDVTSSPASAGFVEACAGGGAAGVGGLLIKGVAVVATVGGLATAGSTSLPAGSGRHHPAAPADGISIHSTLEKRAGSARQPGARLFSGAGGAASASRSARFVFLSSGSGSHSSGRGGPGKGGGSPNSLNGGSGLSSGGEASGRRPDGGSGSGGGEGGSLSSGGPDGGSGSGGQDRGSLGTGGPGETASVGSGGSDGGSSGGGPGRDGGGSSSGGSDGGSSGGSATQARGVSSSEGGSAGGH